MRAVWIQAVFLLLTACSSSVEATRPRESEFKGVGNLWFYAESNMARRISKKEIVKETTILDADRKRPLSNNKGPTITNIRHRIVKRNASDTEPTAKAPTTKAPTVILTPVPPPIFIPPPFTPPPLFTLPPIRIFTPPPIFTVPPIFISPICQPENSCSGRCTNSTGTNSTEWRTELKFACSCDPDCYEVFNDCCADYEHYCGRQKPKNVPTKKYNWTCAAVGYFDSKLCGIGDGIWMVTQCAEDWPNDDTRMKCQSPVTQLTMSTPDLSRYLPVISRGNVTFRNFHCALCNRVEEPYESWPVDIETSVIPPTSYNLTQKIEFLLSHGAGFPEADGPWRPKSSQPRRYCQRDKVDDSCDKSGFSCENGPTAIVSAGYKYFKNIQCAICQDAPSQLISCFPSKVPGRCQGLVPQPFSLVLDYRRGTDNSKEEAKFSVEEQACRNQGMIYDDVLEVCRVNWLQPPGQNGQARFYVIAWLAPQQVSKNIDFSPGDFQKSLGNYFNVPTTQILGINISAIPNPADKTVNSFYLVSLTIILTPQQSLELGILGTYRDTHNTSKPRLLNFIYFKEPLSMVIIKNTSYTIVKTTSRPLACAGKTVYTPMEYTILDQDKVYIDTTNTTYERSEYFKENSPQSNATLGNITVCKKYIPTGCNATWTILEPQQFTITANLSVYHKETSMLYHYGQYDTFSNNLVAVCISVYTIPTRTRESIWGDVILAWISFFGFLLSALFLIFLLVTYILFSQLRTLPGKNLMNLATSLLLFSIAWILLGFDDIRSVQPLCTAMAVITHYLLLAYFSSMAVIAFHTCKVFARRLPALKTSKGYERKLFSLYVFLVWLFPAMFVITCFLCDNKRVMYVGYGDNEVCWLQDKDGYIYLVTTPMALLLLFNTVAFITSAVYLRKHSQNTAARQASGARKSNLSIYIRLSTLMGFTWLFGFLAVIIEPSKVFWYLFMILTPLQGVFVTVAFVMNSKTLRMYKNTSRKLKGPKNSAVPNTTSRKLATHMFENTKL